MALQQIINIIELGLVYGFVAAGIFLTFRILKFSDLTTDGSFVLGAATYSVLLRSSYPIAVCCTAAIIAGMLAGFCTAFLNTRWKINGMLASILVTMMLYSINLRIMGLPNISIFTLPTMFYLGKTVSICLLALAFLVLLIALLKTHLGLKMRAVGFNKTASTLYHISTRNITWFTLALSNGIAAFAGALLTQHQGFADISMGFGVVITGLACVIIGETITRNYSILLSITGCFLGAILYRGIMALILNATMLNLKSSDLKLITSVLILLLVVLVDRKGLSHDSD